MIDRYADDSALVSALKAGSRDALGEAYRRYGRTVYAVARRLTGSPADAEDVLQDLFVGLPNAVQSFAERGSFAGWVKRVAVRMALAKNRTRSGRRELPLDSIPAPSEPPAARSSAEWMALERALWTLSRALRDVFLLREVEGFTHREVARVLGIEVGASKVRLHRAKKELRDCLRDGE